MAETLFYVGATLFVGGTAKSQYDQKKAVQTQNRAARRARQVEIAAANISAARERRRAIAASLVARSESISTAGAQGVDTSSALAGAVGSLNTDTASNIGFATTMNSANRLQSNILFRSAIKSSRLQTSANRAAAVANIGAQLVSYGMSGAGGGGGLSPTQAALTGSAPFHSPIQRKTFTP